MFLLQFLIEQAAVWKVTTFRRDMQMQGILRNLEKNPNAVWTVDRIVELT